MKGHSVQLTVRGGHKRTTSCPVSWTPENGDLSPPPPWNVGSTCLALSQRLPQGHSLEIVMWN